MSIKNLVRRKQAPLSTDPFALFRNEMSRFFDSFWDTRPLLPPLGQGKDSFLPSIEMSETDKTILLTAELPGMTEKDVQVTLSPDASVLTIQGEKKTEDTKEDKNYHHFERSYGSFRRTIELPCPVDDKHAEATFKDGVLKLELGKAPEDKRGIKKIAIRGA